MRRPSDHRDWFILRLAPWIVLAAAVSSLRATPTVPGYVVEEYATIPRPPVTLAFDDSGALFVGVGEDAPNPRLAEAIYRVAPGGISVATYGPSLRDPDAVTVDVTGRITGAPGAVLVGGFVSGSTGHVTAILPDQTTMTLWESSVIGNPGLMTIDPSGRLLITKYHLSVLVYDPTSDAGSPPPTVPPTTLISDGIRQPERLAVASDGDMFVSFLAGDIALYGPDGTIQDADFASGFGERPAMAVASGGLWGTDLYVVGLSTGDLSRVTADGTVTVIGSGFTQAGAIAFDSKGDMYIALRTNGDIYRVIPEPATLMLLLFVSAGLPCRRALPQY